jgi:hypothetical protein
LEGRKSLKSLWRGLCLALTVLTLLVVPAWPQSSTGSVRGTVQDPTGAIIPNVTVALTNTATGVETKSVSNETGFYVFPTVVPGPYRIEAESAGMKKFEATMTVQVQQSTNIPITLQPAGTQTIVSVQDVTPVLTTDTPALGHTLERLRIEQLPINGRNIMNLINTVPGVTFDSDGNMRTFGGRQGTHDVILDGAALTDQVYGGGTVGRPPSLESIQEFRVEMNSTSAKFTRQTSIILTTKSGSNAIHGSLFETNRNNAYGVARARDNFTNTAAKLIRNEFGGTVGGPVLIPKLYNGKNRTFWFFAYEGFKQRTGSFGNYRVPTEAMRNGDFSGLVNASGTLSTIYDPLTTAANFSRQPFNYGGKVNNIDPARISPLMKYIYSQLPLPNIAGVNPLIGNNYSAPNPNIQNQYTYTMRFDHRFSDKDLVYGRITKADASTFRPNAGGVPTLDGFGNSRTDRFPNESLSVDWTRAFSPTFFNEFMFSASRTVSTQFSGDPSRRYSTELGLPNPNGQPGYPVINNVGVGTGSANYFAPTNWNLRYFNYFILENNSTKIKGKHELQFGIHLRSDRNNWMPQQQRTAGAVTFQANTTSLYDPVQSTTNNRVATLNTGHVAAAAYLGYATYEVRVNKGMYYIRQNENAVYFQDNWRVNNRLTLNLGLRWQYTPYPSDKYNIFSSFDPKNMAIVLGQSLDTLYKVGATTPALIKALQGYGAKFESAQDAGLPAKLVYNNKYDIGPHIGFAYRALDARRSFVLRGGLSNNYYWVPGYGWNDRMRNNAPFAGFYQNYALTVAAQSPDGKSNYGLISVPPIVAGKNSANAVSFDTVRSINIGEDSFSNAYFNPKQPSSRVWDWNLTAEKEVMRDTILRVAYVGNHSTHLDSYDDWNAQMPTYVWLMTRKTQPPNDNWASATLRPNPTYPYGNLQEWRKDGWGWSNGIQAEFERRYSKGIGFQLMYMLVNATKSASNGWNYDSSVPPVSSFLPGSIPTDHGQRMRLLLYARDTTIPQHEIRWNWIADLPFGKGKRLGGNSNSFLNAFIGGWQVSGMGRWRTNWFSLPTSNWPTGTKVEYYGHQYPIQDCRSGVCRSGFMMWNGYIPAHQINSTDPKTGKPNGVMGVPSSYKAAYAPLFPYPADYPNRTAATDPNYGYYGSNYIWIPVTDSATPYRIGLNGTTPQMEGRGSPLSPWINQPILSTNLWGCDASMFKSFNIKERAKLRLQFDFFNVFNVPGNSPSAGADGLVSTYSGANSPRTMQISARLTW